jgi:hypothetical protein
MSLDEFIVCAFLAGVMIAVAAMVLGATLGPAHAHHE